MYCKECGKPLPEDAKFCVNCGMKISVSDLSFVETEEHTASVVDADTLKSADGAYVYKSDPEFQWNVEERPKRRVLDPETGEFNWETDIDREQKRAEHERLAQAARRERQRVEQAEKIHDEELRIRALAEEKQRLREAEEKRLADAAEAMRKAEEMLAAHRAKSRAEEERDAQELLDHIDNENKIAEEKAQSESAAKIDKFYTHNQKNEEFQKLLDEQYEKLKNRRAGGQAEHEEQEGAGGGKDGASQGKSEDLNVSKTEGNSIKRKTATGDELLQRMAKERDDETDELIQRSLNASRKFDTKELKRDIIEIALERAGVASEMLDTNFDGVEDPREVFERERNNTMVLTTGLGKDLEKTDIEDYDGVLGEKVSNEPGSIGIQPEIESTGFTPMFKKEAAAADGETTQTTPHMDDSAKPNPQKDLQEEGDASDEFDVVDEQRKRGVFEWLFGKSGKNDEDIAAEEVSENKEIPESEESVTSAKEPEEEIKEELDDVSVEVCATNESDIEACVNKDEMTTEEEVEKSHEEIEDSSDAELNSQMSLRERVGADIRPNESIRETMGIKEVLNADASTDESGADEAVEDESQSDSKSENPSLSELMQDPAVRAKKYRKGSETAELEARKIENEEFIKSKNLSPAEAEAFRRKRALDALWGTMNVEMPKEVMENSADGTESSQEDSVARDEFFDDLPEKSKAGKVIAAIIIVLILADGWAIGTTRFAPSSAAAKFINENCPQTVKWFDAVAGKAKHKESDEDSEAKKEAKKRAEEIEKKEANDRRIALVQKYVANNFNGNIKNIVINPKLAFDKAARYDMDDVSISKPIVSTEWYKTPEGESITHEEAIIATMLAYESSRVDYENSGNKKIQQFTVEGSGAYEAALTKLTKAGEKMEFEELEIGDIRVGNEHFYVWTRETFRLVQADGTNSERIFQKVYFMTGIDNKMLIMGSFN